jgi:hypothetical protein
MSNPLRSIKSKELQEELGVTNGSAAKRKLLRLGVTIFDKEFIDVRELARIAEERIAGKKQPLSEEWKNNTPFD